MTSHKKVLRITAFHALASCYPDLHRPAGPMDENEILLRASEELVELRKQARQVQSVAKEVGLRARKSRHRFPLRDWLTVDVTELESWFARLTEAPDAG